MATLPEARRYARDASGNGYSGALLYVYDQGTSNLSSVYTDAGLSIASANPLTADANGLFAQFYLTQNSLYDTQLKTAAGVLVKQELAVAAVGSTSGIFALDFTTSRGQIRGAAGVTYYEAGDASPDNIGGKMRLGGWSGTQLDTYVVDTANFNSTGDIFTVNGKRLPGVVATPGTTVAASATMDIALTNLPAGCRAYDVDVIDLALSAAGNLAIRFSYDNGVTYKAGGTDYAYATNYNAVNVASSSTNVGLDYGIIGVNNITTPANKLAQLRLRITTVNSGSGATISQGVLSGYDNTGTPVPVTQTSTVFGLGGYGRATHVRILNITAGTIAGVYRVVPQRGLGET